MSQETIEYLNQNVLVGCTDKRGTAWHYRADLQGDLSNHYEGFIPVEDVTSRLFFWDALKVPVQYNLPTADLETATGIDAEGNAFKTFTAADRVVIARSDNGDALGTFKSSYEPHQYREWLVSNVETLLDGGLGVSSAGLLRNGAQGWVEVSVEDTVETPQGFNFRPNLLAVTSLDGSIATTYKRTVTATVCDNTLRAALGEASQTFKIRHTRNSGLRILEARDALDLIQVVADDFSDYVAELSEQAVTDKEFRAIVEALAPTFDLDKGAALTRAERKQDELFTLWNNDDRVTPWKNTLLGVVQAVNTHAHHVAEIRGSTRADRNAAATVFGKFDELDTETLTVANQVLALA